MTTIEVDIRKLLESGAHFGHKTSRWHPKMAPYIHSKRDGIHIIDLTKTVSGINDALSFIEKTVAQGKQVLLIGTKRQAKPVLEQIAAETGMPYVTERWLGGMLTNTKTINGRVKHLKDLESRMASGELAQRYNKLEVQRFQEEIDEMNKKFGGIKELNGKPGAVFIVDLPNEMNAVREARMLNIPVVAMVDSNADPSMADYIIPCNDDAIKTIALVADYVKQAIELGKGSRKKAADVDVEAAAGKTGEVEASVEKAEKPKAEAKPAAKPATKASK